MNRNAGVFSALLFAENVDDYTKQLPEWFWTFSLATIGHSQKNPVQSLNGLKVLIEFFQSDSSLNLSDSSPLGWLHKAWLGPNKNNLEMIIPPVLAGTAWSIYERSSQKEALRDTLEQVYEVALAYHRQLYSQRDFNEDGLIISKNEAEVFGFAALDIDEPFEIFDPFFHAILCWSNSALIQIGGLLSKDVKEVIEWNELTIYSVNEQLWHPVLNSYFPYDTIHDTYLSIPLVQSVLGLYGMMATQEQVEMLYPQLEMQVKDYIAENQQERSLNLINYSRFITLLHATLSYDFDELSQLIAKYISGVTASAETDLPISFQTYVSEGLSRYFE